MINNRILTILYISILFTSCIASRDDVTHTMEHRNNYNEKTISISGVMRENSGFYNLFSNDRQECIGLLLTDSQRLEYKSYVGHRVTVAGILKAEGCGREGICVEHLCSPTIMTGVTVSR